MEEGTQEEYSLRLFSRPGFITGRTFFAQETKNMNALWTQIAENLTFVLTCLALVVGLALLAKLAEKFLPERRTVTPARRVSIIGICAAIAIPAYPATFCVPERRPFCCPPPYIIGFSFTPSRTYKKPTPFGP